LGIDAKINKAEDEFKAPAHIHHPVIDAQLSDEFVTLEGKETMVWKLLVEPSAREEGWERGAEQALEGSIEFSFYRVFWHNLDAHRVLLRSIRGIGQASASEEREAASVASCSGQFLFPVDMEGVRSS
jgi:hypothetical protein